MGRLMLRHCWNNDQLNKAGLATLKLINIGILSLIAKGDIFLQNFNLTNFTKPSSSNIINKQSGFVSHGNSIH